MFAGDLSCPSSNWSYNTSWLGGNLAIANGVVYLQSAGKLNALSTSTGSVIWSVLGVWTSSSPAVANGVLSWGVKKPGSTRLPDSRVTCSRGQQNLLARCREGLNPVMPILTMVKTRMSRRQSAGLLASGTLSSAIISSKHLLDHAAGALVFFNGTTDDEGVCFVWHGKASF